MQSKIGVLQILFSLFAVVALLAVGITRSLPDRYVHIIFCDVGQGDGVLLTHGTKQILIDGGPDAKIVECLSSHMPIWDKTLELVISTHPDADHLTGLISVLQKYQIKTFFLEGRYTPTKTFERFREQLQAKQQQGTQIIFPQWGTEASIDSLILAKIVYPFKKIGDESSFFQVFTETQLSAVAKAQSKVFGATNDGCIAAIFTIGRVKIFTGGDLEEKQEVALIEKGVLTPINIVKAGHHGSKTSNTRRFLDKLRPEIGVISVGKGNRYHHPNQEVLDRFTSFGMKVLRTDELGSIELVTDGEKYWLKP